MANKEHLLKLAYYMEQGSHGTDDDPNNPLSRAVNYLFEDIQRFTRIALCFFGDLNGSLSQSAPFPPVVTTAKAVPTFVTNSSATDATPVSSLLPHEQGDPEKVPALCDMSRTRHRGADGVRHA
jgi:hypothetical protein